MRIRLALLGAGGTSVFGGRGSIYGTFIGAFMVGGISAGIVSVGLTNFWNDLIYGAKLRVKDGEVVKAGQLMAEWDPFTLPIIVEATGTIEYGDIIEGVTMQVRVDETTQHSSMVIQESRDRAYNAGIADRATFVWRDIFDVDLSPATVVTIYLFPEVNARLLPKLRRELRPGTRIVSHQYPIGDWKPDRWTQIESSFRRHTLLFWTVPAKP